MLLVCRVRRLLSHIATWVYRGLYVSLLSHYFSRSAYCSPIGGHPELDIVCSSKPNAEHTVCGIGRVCNRIAARGRTRPWRGGYEHGDAFHGHKGGPDSRWDQTGLTASGGVSLLRWSRVVLCVCVCVCVCVVCVVWWGWGYGQVLQTEMIIEEG